MRRILRVFVSPLARELAQPLTRTLSNAAGYNPATSPGVELSDDDGTTYLMDDDGITYLTDDAA